MKFGSIFLQRHKIQRPTALITLSRNAAQEVEEEALAPRSTRAVIIYLYAATIRGLDAFGGPDDAAAAGTAVVSVAAARGGAQGKAGGGIGPPGVEISSDHVVISA